MDWVVAHNWINTLILGVLGIAVLVHTRWQKFRWFVCYALIGTFLAVLYKVWFYNHPFYLFKLVTTNRPRRCGC